MPVYTNRNLPGCRGKANSRKPAEMCPNVDFSNGESERQTIACQQAEQASIGSMRASLINSRGRDTQLMQPSELLHSKITQPYARCLSAKYSATILNRAAGL